MSLIVYPDTNYNSWLDDIEADEYLEDRLNADPWDAALNKEAALITAFNSLAELDLTIDPTETDQITALKQAQCEQALHELKNDLDSTGISSLSLGGLLSVKIPESNAPPSRFSERVLAILRPYLSGRSIKRTR
jgi:hypothetical protein